MHPLETRKAVELLAVKGAAFEDLSRDFNIPLSTIVSWSQRDQWATPQKRVEADRAARRKAAKRLAEVAQREAPATQMQQSCDKPQLPATSHPQLAQLIALAQTGPPEFVKQATAYLQTLLAENANCIEINNLRDWKEVWTMWRQGAGLDKQATGGNGNAPLVNPIRTVSRRSGPVIDAEPIPENTPLDEWEP
jgi:hypothetical protein